MTFGTSLPLSTCQVDGQKLSKERITIGVIVNSNGKIMTKPIVIGKSKSRTVSDVGIPIQ